MTLVYNFSANLKIALHAQYMDIRVFKKFYILKMQLSTCIFLYLVTAVFFFFLPIAYTFNNSRGARSNQAVVLG